MGAGVWPYDLSLSVCALTALVFFELPTTFVWSKGSTDSLEHCLLPYCNWCHLFRLCWHSFRNVAIHYSRPPSLLWMKQPMSPRKSQTSQGISCCWRVEDWSRIFSFNEMCFFFLFSLNQPLCSLTSHGFNPLLMFSFSAYFLPLDLSSLTSFFICSFYSIS